MTLPLNTEQQERLLNGHKAILKAANAVAKAQSDLLMFPHSGNYRRRLKDKIAELSKLANEETKIVNQTEIF